MQYLCLILLLLLTSCCRQIISVRTEYFNRHSLASYFVETPDPKQSYPEVGQRLILSWAIPADLKDITDLELVLTIRFGNKKEVVKHIPVSQRSGIYVYTLRDCEFFDVDGIQTYKVELMGSGMVLTTWYHQLWTEIIRFDEENSAEE